MKNVHVDSIRRLEMHTQLAWIRLHDRQPYGRVADLTGEIRALVAAAAASQLQRPHAQNARRARVHARGLANLR